MRVPAGFPRLPRTPVSCRSRTSSPSRRSAAVTNPSSAAAGPCSYHPLSFPCRNRATARAKEARVGPADHHRAHTTPTYRARPWPRHRHPTSQRHRSSAPTVSLSLHSFSSSSLLASLMKTVACCNLQESGKATAKHPIPYSHLFISDGVAQDSKPAAASTEAEKVGRPKHMAVC